MKGRSLEERMDILGRKRVDDPQIQKPIYRKVSFGPLALTGEIEKLISSQIREVLRTVLAPYLVVQFRATSR